MPAIMRSKPPNQILTVVVATAKPPEPLQVTTEIVSYRFE